MFDASAFAAGLAAVVAALAVLFAATFAVALAQHRHSVIDVTWGLGFVAVAAVSFAASAGDGDLARRVVLLTLTGLWGLRLAWHIARRNRGTGEDPRYEDMLAGAGPDRGARNRRAARTIYPVQAAGLLFISLPVQVGQYSTTALGPLAAAGTVVWVVGLAFEAVGDAQLARFKADPANRGAVMDRGLWRYTRHPNYFGDACVWWGLFLVAAEAWPGVLTVGSPVLMTFLLVRGTGAALTESRMAGRPGFADYVSRTSGFVPLPPRAGRGAGRGVGGAP